MRPSVAFRALARLELLGPPLSGCNAPAGAPCPEIDENLHAMPDLPGWQLSTPAEKRLGPRLVSNPYEDVPELDNLDGVLTAKDRSILAAACLRTLARVTTAWYWPMNGRPG